MQTFKADSIEVDETVVEMRISEKAAEFGTTAAALGAQLEKGGGKERHGPTEPFFDQSWKLPQIQEVDFNGFDM